MTCRSTCVDYNIIMLNSFVAKTCISYTWYDVPFRQHLLTKCWPNFFHSKIWCLSFQTPYREMPYGFWIKNYIALKINHIFQFCLHFTIIKNIVRIHWKKLKIQMVPKSDVYIAQHRSTRHLKALTLKFNGKKILLKFSQHLLTKNLLTSEQAHLVLHIGHVCF